VKSGAEEPGGRPFSAEGGLSSPGVGLGSGEIAARPVAAAVSTASGSAGRGCGVSVAAALFEVVSLPVTRGRAICDGELGVIVSGVVVGVAGAEEQAARTSNPTKAPSPHTLVVKRVIETGFVIQALTSSTTGHPEPGLIFEKSDTTVLQYSADGNLNETSKVLETFEVSSGRAPADLPKSKGLVTIVSLNPVHGWDLSENVVCV